MCIVKGMLSYCIKYGLQAATPIHPQSVCGCLRNSYDVTTLQNIPHLYFKISYITTRGPANCWGVQQRNSNTFSYNDLMIKIAHISLVLQIHALSTRDLLHIDVGIDEPLELNNRVAHVDGNEQTHKCRNYVS